MSSVNNLDIIIMQKDLEFNALGSLHKQKQEALHIMHLILIYAYFRV